jgi:hypothetical protein
MTVRARCVVILGLLALSRAGAADAQNSVYGIAGIGFPGDPLSVAARALGGGPAAVDPYSALNPATVVGLPNLVAAFSGSTTLRRYTAAGDTAIGGLRETRFPYGMFGGHIATTPVSFALSFSTYAERTYDVTSTGTQVLRGDTLQVTDRLGSDGAVTDLRGALALRPWSRLLVGAAVHMLGGSSRLDVRRVFSDSAYLPFVEQRRLVFSGYGVSGGVVLRPTRAIELAAAARLDGRLTARLEGDSVGSARLPVSLTAGLRLTPARGLGWSATATHRSWSRTQPDLAPSTQAFDTWEVASGLELGSLPLRVGVRYRQLPFSNVATQPTELVFAGGSGLVLARGRAALSFAIERFRRSGGGADEQGWQFTAGVMVVP